VEHVVMDGGSDDGSLEIIERWEGRLAHWVSEPAGGQYDAINRGFATTSGEVLAWLNSDDMYLPGALHLVGEIFAQFPDVEWLTTQFPITWDEDGVARTCAHLRGMSSAAALRGQYLTGGPWHSVGVVQQESTFWRRSLWERAGGYVDAGMRYAGDFDLWMRLAAAGELCTVAAPLAGFRRHGDQKTAADGVAGYFAEASDVLASRGTPSVGRVAGFRRRVMNRLSGPAVEPRPASVLSDVILGRGASHVATSFTWVNGAWRRATERIV
jgi:glycosyltransferase involved in cell wall biosynthesis